eukprot:4524094-Alexandrium_andersonii.AAC.1
MPPTTDKSQGAQAGIDLNSVWWAGPPESSGMVWVAVGQSRAWRGTITSQSYGIRSIHSCPALS